MQVSAEEEGEEEEEDGADDGPFDCVGCLLHISASAFESLGVWLFKLVGVRTRLSGWRAGSKTAVEGRPRATYTRVPPSIVKAIVVWIVVVIRGGGCIWHLSWEEVSH